MEPGQFSLFPRKNIFLENSFFLVPNLSAQVNDCLKTPISFSCVYLEKCKLVCLTFFFSSWILISKLEYSVLYFFSLESFLSKKYLCIVSPNCRCFVLLLNLQLISCYLFGLFVKKRLIFCKLTELLKICFSFTFCCHKSTKI